MIDDDYGNMVEEMLESEDRGFTNKNIEFLDEMSTLGIYTENMKNAIQTLYDLKGF